MRPVPAWFQGLAWVMTALLAVSVALQYNDPDPVRWMAIYGAGAVVSAMIPARRPLWTAALALGAVTAAWGIYLTYAVWDVIQVPDLVNKMSEKGGAVEVGREAGGLGIQAVWLLFAGAFRATRT